TAAQANTGRGVFIDLASNNTVGGNTAAERNIISRNVGEGVRLDGSGANGYRVRGNFSGTDLTGTASLGNSSSGVAINGASGNMIGGVGAGNLIAFNGGDGVSVISGTGNRVLSN